MDLPADQEAVGRDIVAIIDGIRRAPARRDELIDLLREQSAVYRGLGAQSAERLRGYVLASFETVGLPDDAMPFVLEELETGLNPYTVAAAAKALRGAGDVPQTAIALLRRAVTRVEGNDDYVQYGALACEDPAAAPTTAMVEILRTLSALGPRAGVLRPVLDAMAERAWSFSPDVLAAIERARLDISASPPAACCCSSDPVPLPRPAAQAAAAGAGAIDEVILQDQDGATFTYRDFFHGRASIATFFYTRCMNPEKCSLTISKLARLQRSIGDLDLG
jgi:hypothetical protein